MRPIGCPETSVRNYHYSLRNNPGRSPHLPSDGNLRFPVVHYRLYFIVMGKFIKYHSERLMLSNYCESIYEYTFICSFCNLFNYGLTRAEGI